MITLYQFTQIKLQDEITVFSRSKQWLTAVVTKVNPTAEIIKVSYSDKSTELHTRMTIK
jgi:hypothetical protein